MGNKNSIPGSGGPPAVIGVQAAVQRISESIISSIVHVIHVVITKVHKLWSQFSASNLLHWTCAR